MKILRQILQLSHLAKAPSGESTRERQSLVSFIRSYEPKVLNTSHPDIEEVRRLLGWDAESLENFVATPLLTHSSPHASMNVFAPNFSHPWIHSAIESLPENQLPQGNAFHLRTMLTHNNISDTKYRPYAFWSRDTDGKIAQFSVYSRGNSRRHKALVALELPDIKTDKLAHSDAKAIRLAGAAKNYAYFCLIYRCSLEAQSNLARAGRHLEAPLDIINAWIYSRVPLAPTIKHFGMPRYLDEKGEVQSIELQSVEGNGWGKTEHSLIAPIFLNFAQIYRLGIAVTTGGKKMKAYVPEMNRMIQEYYADINVACPLPKLLTLTELPWSEILQSSTHDLVYYKEKRMEGSFSVAVADLGAKLRTALDKLLDGSSAEVSLI